MPPPRVLYVLLRDVPRSRMRQSTPTSTPYRRGNILYDEDPDGHALRHFYVASAQGGVLFEIVDREPGYAGYGAENALVRMAALESA